jgi:dolichol-phosphate mannosyltransferase
MRLLSQAQTGLAGYIKFCIVGGSGLFVDMMVLHLLLSSEAFGTNITVAKVVAAECALVNNFVWNELWTFRSRVDQASRTSKFLLIRFLGFQAICALGIFASAVILNLLVYVMGLNVYFSNFIAIICVSIFNFWLCARFNWRPVNCENNSQQ